jgi:hypothetical protein
VSRIKHNPKKNRNRVQSNARDRLVGKYTAAIRSMPLKNAVYEIKTSTDPVDLFAIFPRLFKSASALERVHGKSFPTTLQQLFSAKAPYSPAARRSELVWAICRCIQHAAELQEFNRLRQVFEKGILEDSKADSVSTLDNVESKFGQSTWLLQAKLCASQHWGGLDELQRLAALYEPQLAEGTLTHLLFWFFRRRIEATSLKDHLKSNLSRILQQTDNKELEEYLTTKIFEQADVPLPNVASCLFFEGQSSIIDLYEMLVHVLQSIASFAFLPDELHASLAKPVNVLFTKIDDSRLRGVLRRFGTIAPEQRVTPPERAMAIEAYTRSNYAECVRLVNAVLGTTIDDIPIFVLGLKAHVQLASEPSPRTGILNAISGHLLEILRFTQDTYTAAHEIMTLADRFYGQSWIGYIRALVLYELRQESEIFPPLWLRDIFVRDPCLTPFSAVGMEHEPAAAMLSSPAMEDSFPTTLSVYRAVTTGVVSDSLAVSDKRVSKYLATYHLVFGNPHQALNHYKSLMERTTGPEKIRCAGGAALANLKIGDLKEATEIVVQSFLENPNVPSALPIKAVIDALGDPSKWPNSIAVPLVFELYLSYCDGDKLADLRYSFERFQLTNNISNPTALVACADQMGMEMVVAYLERVWRPEIMRQTLLYDGTREIEEARIQVCRTISELLPEKKAMKYLEEIKERVKQQEIAKGTRLVEQSKVYVDIDAIKKTLRAKLGDSYARYKFASASTPSQPDELVEELSKIISQSVKSDISVARVLSSLHLVEPVGNETDAQFTALFTEVTNEFLRGDHGLNAYLSTRVRHGALSNTLRKPVEDENLVTPRDENRTSYVRNTHWLSLTTFADHETARDILYLLDSFSAEFDRVLDQLKDKLLQIRVVHDLSNSDDNPDALFVYRSSNLERRLMQEYDRTDNDIEQLLDRCVETLWEKTDENLTNVRRVIETKVRDQLMETFDNLTTRLASLDYLPIARDLLNAVARAKTNTQMSLTLVSSWFRRNEVYDRQDYSIDFPVQIALNMVRKTISTAAHWTDMEIRCKPEGCGTLPGRTLDGMVYIFYGLLENAIKRSRVPIDDLSVQVELSFDQGNFRARVINNIDGSEVTPEELNRIDRIRNSLELRESNRLAQVEGRSGLHKVWLAINAPIYLTPSLAFEIEGNFFVVDLSYSCKE